MHARTAYSQTLIDVVRLLEVRAGHGAWAVVRPLIAGAAAVGTAASFIPLRDCAVTLTCFQKSNEQC
jgi:hypothetical protein